MIDSSINPNIDRIALRLKSIPENPGVYEHLDAQGKVIYVGKARNLHKRVSQYFTNYDEKGAKIQMLVRNIHDIRVTVVATEVDALLLENNLIKRYQPRYNSLLKDDKTYPYLCITDEEYPRLILTRNRTTPGRYFGPYPNGRTLRELQDILRQLFPIRTCRIMEKRPCLKYQMGRCKAPCGGLQSHDEYLADVEGVASILKGDFGEIVEELQRRMFAEASQLRFEEADALKRKIRRLKEYQSRSTVVGTNVKDVDVFSILSDDGEEGPESGYAYVNIMRIKNGSVIQSFSREIRKRLDESDTEILETAIPALHEQTGSSAKEAIVPFVVEGIPEEYLKQTVPSRGDRLQLLQLSQRNVEAYRRDRRHQRVLLAGEHENRLKAPNAKLIEDIQRLLRLPSPPRHIECFDNSNIQGAYPVAAMVRFTDGKPDRKEYRRFNIKTVEGPDDYASMAEVILRRYKRLSQETDGNPSPGLPDLLIVDGGRGQMEVARQVIRDELQLNIPIAGLAKDGRHHTSQLLCYDPSCSVILTVGLKPTDPLFHLLEQIQNEVHRFAISFHRDKRSKGTFRTALTDIPGIGEKTARDLLLTFGSLKELRLQSQADIAKVIGPAKAKKVVDYFQG